MQDGICPQCNATAVHALATYGAQGGIPLGGFDIAFLTYLVCTACGYVETYILDEADLQKVVRYKNAMYVRPTR